MSYMFLMPMLSVMLFFMRLVYPVLYPALCLACGGSSICCYSFVYPMDNKQGFITWLMNLDSTDFDPWVLGGDVNLIRGPENRNKPGGDLGEMNLFNEAISDLDLVDIPFSGRNYTWSNMQEDPLLVKLDWILTSPSWTLTYPTTIVQPLARPLSDHIPYVLHIGTSIPKSRIFRFEISGLIIQVFLTLLNYIGAIPPFLPMLPGIYP